MTSADTGNLKPCYKDIMVLKEMDFTGRTKNDCASASIQLAVLSKSGVFCFVNEARGNQLQSETECHGRK